MSSAETICVLFEPEKRRANNGFIYRHGTRRLEAERGDALLRLVSIREETMTNST